MATAATGGIGKQHCWQLQSHVHGGCVLSWRQAIAMARRLASGTWRLVDQIRPAQGLSLVRESLPR